MPVGAFVGRVTAAGASRCDKGAGLVGCVFLVGFAWGLQTGLLRVCVFFFGSGLRVEPRHTEHCSAHFNFDKQA